MATSRGRHTLKGGGGSADRRGRPNARATALWASGAAAALMLVLGVDGTLSSWTSAVIANSTNTAATATAVILQETGPASQGSPVCYSSDGAQTTVNSSTCTTVNTYGGTAAPLTPGGSLTVDVVFKNVGGANASSFQLAPGTCTQTPVAGTGTPTAANVCTNGDLTVAVSCSPGTTYSSASAWPDLAYAAGAPSTTTKAHAASGGDLNAGATWTCRATVALLAAAAVTDQGVTVSQPLTWTLAQ